jgi:hypothetical protein
MNKGLLCGVSFVVHKEKIEFTSVVHKKCFVAGGHHVAGLLVVAIADLQ